MSDPDTPRVVLLEALMRTAQPAHTALTLSALSAFFGVSCAPVGYLERPETCTQTRAKDAYCDKMELCCHRVDLVRGKKVLEVGEEECAMVVNGRKRFECPPFEEDPTCEGPITRAVSYACDF